MPETPSEFTIRTEFTEEQLFRCVGLAIGAAAAQLDETVDDMSAALLAEGWPDDVDEDALTVALNVAVALASAFGITAAQLYDAAAVAMPD